MRRYVSGDYAGAIPELSAAARLSPDAPHISFFLAICHLLTGQIDADARRLLTQVEAALRER
jgi:hypothetical protein